MLRSVVDVDGRRLTTVELLPLHQVAGDRIQVVDVIANQFVVTDTQHPQIDLLCQVRCIRFAADASKEERAQFRAMVGKQPLNQGQFRFSHGHRNA